MKTDPKITSAKIVERLERCRKENDNKEKLLQEYREVIRELLEIAERHVYMHGNDYSVTDRRETIKKAKSLLHQPNRAI